MKRFNLIIFIVASFFALTVQAQTVKKVEFYDAENDKALFSIQHKKIYSLSNMPAELGLVIQLSNSTSAAKRLKNDSRKIKKNKKKKHNKKKKLKKLAASLSPILDFTLKNFTTGKGISPARERNAPYSFFGNINDDIFGQQLSAGRYALYISVIDPKTLKRVSSYSVSFELTGKSVAVTPLATATSVPQATTAPTNTPHIKPTLSPTSVPTVVATVGNSPVKFTDYKFQLCKGKGCGKTVKVLDGNIKKDGGFSNRTRFGGIASQKVNSGTGYFSVANFNGRKVLVDPDGYRYFDVSLNSVAPNVLSETKTGKQYINADEFKQAFGGSQSTWAQQTRTLLKTKGFTSIGAWSSFTSFFNHSDKLNYSFIANFLKDYCQQSSKQCAVMGTGHANYKVDGISDVLPVFDADFKTYAEKKVAELVTEGKLRINDQHLIGIFTDNELPLGKQTLSKYLTLKSGNPNRNAAVAFRDHGTLDNEFTSAYPNYKKDLGSNDAIWQAYVAWKYAKVVRDAFRKKDSHHLILGSRFTWPTIRDNATWYGQRTQVDVISCNWYDDVIWASKVFPQMIDGAAVNLPENPTNELAKKYNMPVMITEFYAKGNDMLGVNGIDNVGGAGLIVKNQFERGMHYQGVLSSAIGSGTVAGIHYFMYMDNNPGASSDPSNRSANKGIVNIFWETYDPLLNEMERFNSNLGKIIPFLEKK